MFTAKDNSAFEWQPGLVSLLRLIVAGSSFEVKLDGAPSLPDLRVSE